MTGQKTLGEVSGCSQFMSFGMALNFLKHVVGFKIVLSGAQPDKKSPFDRASASGSRKNLFWFRPGASSGGAVRSKASVRQRLFPCTSPLNRIEPEREGHFNEPAGLEKEP
jgi:hypothetical protein